MRGRDARGGHGGSGRRPGVPLVMSDGRWGHSEIMESGPHAVVEGPVVFAVVVGAERVDLGEVRVEVVVVEALVRGRRAAAGQLDVLQQRHHVVPQRLVVLSQLRASLTSTSRLLLLDLESRLHRGDVMAQFVHVALHGTVLFLQLRDLRGQTSVVLAVEEARNPENPWACV